MSTLLLRGLVQLCKSDGNVSNPLVSSRLWQGSQPNKYQVTHLHILPIHCQEEFLTRPECSKSCGHPIISTGACCQCGDGVKIFSPVKIYWMFKYWNLPHYNVALNNSMVSKCDCVNLKLASRGNELKMTFSILHKISTIIYPRLTGFWSVVPLQVWEHDLVVSV